VIPISRPEIGPAEEQAVLEVLRSGKLSMGPRTEAFEHAWAELCGVRHAVLMANGTVTLEALLRCLHIGSGDEVVTVSFSFNATASAVMQTGARPVFVDIRESDFTIDPELVEAAITPRTKAIMPVHLFGLVADMAPLVEISTRRDLLLIEDAAQAHGARYEGRMAGSFGPAMFSLYATKNLMTGEGGLATTDDGELAERIRLYRNHGMSQRYRHTTLGTNFRPTELTAALGLAGLAALDDRNERRRRNAAFLSRELADYHVPSVPKGRDHVWHQFTMRFPGERDHVAAGLAERGVGTMIYYPVPIHRQPYLRRLMPELEGLSLPVTEQAAQEVLSLPVHPTLAQVELETIVAAVREVATPRRASASVDRQATERAALGGATLGEPAAGGPAA